MKNAKIDVIVYLLTSADIIVLNHFLKIVYYIFCVKQHIFVEYLILKWFSLQFGHAHAVY